MKLTVPELEQILRNVNDSLWNCGEDDKMLICTLDGHSHFFKINNSYLFDCDVLDTEETFEDLNIVIKRRAVEIIIELDNTVLENTRFNNIFRDELKYLGRKLILD